MKTPDERTQDRRAALTTQERAILELFDDLRAQSAFNLDVFLRAARTDGVTAHMTVHAPAKPGRPADVDITGQGAA